MQEYDLVPQIAAPYDITDQTNESNNFLKTSKGIPPKDLYFEITKPRARLALWAIILAVIL